MMEEYPDAQLLIDFHRDSGVSKEDCTVSLPQGDAATLLLVVGSNMTMNIPIGKKTRKLPKLLEPKFLQ